MTTTTHSTTRNEDAARWRKVTRLAAVAEARGIAAATLARIDDKGWEALAGLAGVRTPSATTRTQTIGYLNGKETAREFEDPFAGL